MTQNLTSISGGRTFIEEAFAIIRHCVLCVKKLLTSYQPKAYEKMKNWWVDHAGCSSATQISHRDVILQVCYEQKNVLILKEVFSLT